jgi:hypothetical protein
LLLQAARRDAVATSAADASVLVIYVPLLPLKPHRNDGDIVRPPDEPGAGSNLKPA